MTLTERRPATLRTGRYTQLMNEMTEFSIETVGTKAFKRYNSEMPNANKVSSILTALWNICWEKDPQFSPSDELWSQRPDCRPAGEFQFRERNDKDPVFRTRDFEGKNKDALHQGLDLLGTYQPKDSLVTIYIDSCIKAARRYSVEWKNMAEVVLVHELAHLVTHNGFRGFLGNNLSPEFMEHTAQCVTYAYLRRSGSSEVFERLSTHQPFIYRTWEPLAKLPEAEFPQRDSVSLLVKCLFQGAAWNLRPIERHEMHDYLTPDS